MKENQPSQTAIWIAKGLLFLDKTKQISNYLEPSAVEIYKQCLELTSKDWLEKLNRSFYIKMMSWGERVTLPGLFIHFFLRKEIIKRWMQEALAQGYEQVIVLAAGFDALVTTQYRQYPKVNFIEIDHPATQHIKKQAFYRNNFSPKNVFFLSADISKQPLRDVFQNAPEINPNLKTFLIVEGLTMYFTKEENLKFFQECVNYFKNDLLVAFSFMNKRANGSINFEQTSIITKAWLKYHKEVFKWGCSLDKLDDEFLQQINLKLVELVCPKNEANLYKGIFFEEEIAEGEYLCLAKRPSDTHSSFKVSPSLLK